MDPDKLIVYVADDNEAVRKCMMRLLKTFNRVSKIKAASDGNELLNLVDAETPDVVILDVEMPVLNGIETAQRLHTRYPEVKILMLTMHQEAVIRNQKSPVAIHGFLSKSDPPDQLEHTLYSILSP
jgi:DNA-binding NarL/FixJ family response regulator